MSADDYFHDNSRDATVWNGQKVDEGVNFVQKNRITYVEGTDFHFNLGRSNDAGSIIYAIQPVQRGIQVLQRYFTRKENAMKQIGRTYRLNRKPRNRVKDLDETMQQRFQIQYAGTSNRGNLPMNYAYCYRIQDFGNCCYNMASPIDYAVE